MNREALLQWAEDNLEATYVAIGSASPEALIQNRQGYTLCLGRLDHPVGNFAVVRQMMESTARELAISARGRSSFHAYVPDTESRSETGRAFAEAGLRRSYGLVQMLCDPTPHAAECAITEAKTEKERLRIASFMTSQFFTRQRPAVRERISWVTAHSGLGICEIHRRGQFVGAVMISRSPGMLGIYNLCIEARSRGRGHGSDAVARLLDMARAEGSMAVLQADASLCDWYGGLGFEQAGIVDVFAPQR